MSESVTVKVEQEVTTGARLLFTSFGHIAEAPRHRSWQPLTSLMQPEHSTAGWKPPPSPRGPGVNRGLIGEVRDEQEKSGHSIALNVVTTAFMRSL